MARHILVIKLGALGDFVQAMGPMAAIRAHHAGDRITLLTTKPFAELAGSSPWFDAVWVDDKPKLHQPLRWLALARRLRGGAFDFVWDLQTSDRSCAYFRLMGRPPWSGNARGCSHPHANPARGAMHTVDRQAEQLAMAGIDAVPPPDLSWMPADIAGFGLPARFAVLAPGGAPHRPAKRWPAGHFAELATRLAQAGLAPVLTGTESERAANARIMAACPSAIDLTGRTSRLADLVGLGRAATLALGNDTGPMHLLAAAGCRCAVLFSAESDPARCAPRGAVTVLRRPDLADLPVAEVAASLGIPA
ncbi:MAG: glycosyltransferase family 9 protein [Alphaproteobacteria bacterium]|nr:glycosyltransferase family 9 protein [Alphaproteobacteria bacterium]